MAVFRWAGGVSHDSLRCLLQECQKNPVKTWGNIKYSVLLGCDQIIWGNSAFCPCSFFSPVTVSLLCYQQHHFLENCGKLLLLFFVLQYSGPCIEMCEVSSCCPWVRMIPPSPSTGCTATVRADGERSPVLPHTTELCATGFPSWSSITHQMQRPRKASQAMILWAVGPAMTFSYLLMERNHAWSLEHSPWPWCGTAVTLAFSHCFYWVTTLFSSWLQLSLGS